VESEPAEERPWQLVARTIGSLTADEMARIRTEIAGMVREIHVEEGQDIRAGTELLRIDAERAQLDVQRAEARHNEALALLNRRRPLHDQNMISEAELIEAEANFQAAEAELGLARRRLADTTVRAPIDGVLGRRYISRGDFAETGTILFDLVKMNILKLDFDLPERYLPLVGPGQRVRVRSAAYPDRLFEGEVYFIDPIIRTATRTIQVRARIENHERLLRPNQFVHVELDVTLLDAAVVVPEQAVISDLGAYALYVVNDDNRAERRPLRIGEREPGTVQIIEGVSPGERVVVSGHQRLQPGVRVTERQPTGE
jgi:membrane fusion protein (multidrug efflux system)